MKLLFSLASVGYVLAQNEAPVAASFKRMQIEYNEILAAEQAAVTTPALADAPRAISTSDDTITMLENYGCWCYAGENHGRGKSQPVDEIDEICKTLHNGYECLILDAQAENVTCDKPWESNYRSANRIINVDLVENCNRFNRNKSMCEINTCIIEGHFIRSVLNLMFQGGRISSKFRHYNDNQKAVFKPEKKCKIEPGVDSAKMCCNTFPYRFPFKTTSLNGATRGCCNGKTFNADFYFCCDDGNGNQVKGQVC